MCILLIVASQLALTSPSIAQVKPNPNDPPSTRDRVAHVLRKASIQKGGTIRFREIRSIARLKSNVVLSGTLSYVPPNKLVRTVEQPRFEKTEVIGNKVSIWTKAGRQTRTGHIEDFPTLDGLISALRAVLAGKIGLLRRQFAVGFQEKANGWVIRLLPKRSKVQERVSEIIVAGDDTRLRTLTLRLTNGDKTLIEMEP